MLNQLKANLGKRVGIELSSGSKLFGTLLAAEESTLRIETDEGIAHLLLDSVQVLWEDQESLEETDIQQILKQVKGTIQTRYVCLGGNGFNCPQNYTCRPPHACNRFFCPGFFTTAFVPPPPPDEPCVGQFFGFKRQTNDANKKPAESSKDKETTE